MENVLLTKKNFLVCPDINVCTDINIDEHTSLLDNFCGIVCHTIHKFNSSERQPNTVVYFIGDIGKNYAKLKMENVKYLKVIKEHSINYKETSDYQLISKGEVPLNVHNVGILFPKLFDDDIDHFDEVTKAHQFQSLTESNKKGTAFRKGIYLTDVKESDNEIKFKLLRCSTNLSGPTDNLRDADKYLIGKVNTNVRYFLEKEATLNHVLAQVYQNQIIEEDGQTKERKAKISVHSDKTKDMPKTGLIAFTTLYKGYTGKHHFNQPDTKHIKKSKENSYDCTFKGNSVLTRLRFRLKSVVKDESLTPDFDVVLYPNSVFVIPLSTNRLYTHEIVPSQMPVADIPTRMGYVIRCSNTDAVFRDNKTYIVKDGKYIELEEQTEEGVRELKEKYFKENVGIEMVTYDDVHFSLNKGDYTKPLV